MIFLTILFVVFIFGLLIFIHELGHFVAARRSKVEVDEFGLGFPPRLYGRKVGRTIYSINWLPLGGFVKLKGEDTADNSAGSFGAASFWSKTKILAAGVSMNLAAAYLILVWLCVSGLPPLIPSQFSFGTPVYNQPKQVMAVQVAEDSPAARAGLQRGDMIVKANGQLIQNEQELVDFTKANAGQAVELETTQAGSTKNLRVQLRDASETGGFLGVTPLQTYKLQYSMLDAVVTAAGITLQLMWATLAAFGALIVGLFATGQVSEQVAGPVGIVAILTNIMQFGFAYVLSFIASISISLAVINALPLPALDGGRWFMIAAQKVSGRRLSDRAEGMVHAAGFFALIALMVVVTFFDIQRLG